MRSSGCSVHGRVLLHDGDRDLRRVPPRVVDAALRNEARDLVVVVAPGVEVPIEPREVRARDLDTDPVARGEIVAGRHWLERHLVDGARFHPGGWLVIPFAP